MAAIVVDKSIQQRNYDPTSPRKQYPWILKRALTDTAPAGSPIGMLMMMTYAADSTVYQYQFSYRSKESTTLRVTLTEDDPYLEPAPVVTSKKPVGLLLTLTH